MAVLSSEDRTFWEENGYVVIHDAAPPELIQNAAQAVWDFLEMDAKEHELGETAYLTELGKRLLGLETWG